MLKIILCLGLLFYVPQANAQMAHISAKSASAPKQSVAPKPQQQSQQNPAPSVNNTPQAPVNNKNAVKKEQEQWTSSYMPDYGDARDARNIMIVAKVADYKLGDENLAPEYERLRYNKEYNQKIKEIMQNLDNGKYPNSKNRQVINILREAGNKLYNLLAD